MKKISKTTLIMPLIISGLIASGCASNVPAVSNEAALAEALNPAPDTLLIKVDGFKMQEGRVAVAVFDEAGYKGGAPIRGQNADVLGDSVLLKIENLPAGEYGIKMYQDVDGNGEMNANAFGLPTEPYAFSNNAVGMMGPAKWDAAKFTVTEAGAVQQISFQ